jgi:hypothetical protein
MRHEKRHRARDANNSGTIVNERKSRRRIRAAKLK